MQGALFFAWPFIDSFPEYVALAVVMEVAGTLGGTAHGAYVIDILPPAERVESRAYMYSALNVGFSVGAFLGAGAIAFGTDVLRWGPVLSGVLFLANSAAILRLPDATHDVRGNEPRAKPEGIPAIRNRGWIAVTTLTGVLWTNQVLLHTVIPVWLVTETDAPRVLVAVLFGTNTLMCIVLPRLASRGIRDVDTALRAVRLSALFFVLTCRHHPGDPRDRGLGDDRAVLPRPHRPHLGRAVPLRLRLDPRGRADGPATPRRLPRRLRSSAAPSGGSGHRRSTASSRWSGALSAGSPSPASSSRRLQGSTSPPAPVAGSSWRNVPADVLADARAGGPDVEDAAAGGPPSMRRPGRSTDTIRR